MDFHEVHDHQPHLEKGDDHQGDGIVLGGIFTAEAVIRAQPPGEDGGQCQNDPDLSLIHI